jgi:hypothetical protein
VGRHRQGSPVSISSRRCAWHGGSPLRHFLYWGCRLGQETDLSLCSVKELRTAATSALSRNHRHYHKLVDGGIHRRSPAGIHTIPSERSESIAGIKPASNEVCTLGTTLELVSAPSASAVSISPTFARTSKRNR